MVESFSNKAAGRMAALLKRGSNTGVPVKVANFLKTTFQENTVSRLEKKKQVVCVDCLKSLLQKL